MKLSRLEQAIILIAAVFLSFTAGWFLRGTVQAEPLTVESERRLAVTTTALPAPVTPAPAPAAASSVVPSAPPEETLVPAEETIPPLPSAVPTEEAAPEEEEEKSQETGGRININTADAETLMELPGIGEKRAAAILADREANGPFRFPEDLTRVKGIGDSILAGLRDQITTE